LTVEVRPDPEGFDRLFVTAPELDAEFQVFGACPVQALGTVRGRDLFFRARHGKWWFEVADSAGTLPSDGGVSEPDGFYRDGIDPDYGRMPLPEAVAVIAECLREYTRGRAEPSRST
jgi:hypothetical protein